MCRKIPLRNNSSVGCDIKSFRKSAATAAMTRRAFVILHANTICMGIQSIFFDAYSYQNFRFNFAQWYIDRSFYSFCLYFVLVGIDIVFFGVKNKCASQFYACMPISEVNTQISMVIDVSWSIIRTNQHQLTPFKIPKPVSSFYATKSKTTKCYSIIFIEIVLRMIVSIRS